jgi:molybdenum cofactor cytidylyltransferase
MGVPKLLLPWQGRPLIAHTIAAWLAGGVSRVFVIPKPSDLAVAQAAREAGATVALPPAPPTDMKASVQCGLAHLAEQENPADDDAWLLAPADMPRLSAPIVARLIAMHEANPGQILVPTRAGRRGHPVLFPWPMAREVHGLADFQGVNSLFALHRWLEVPSDDLPAPAGDPFADIDTPEQYRALKEAE